MTFSNPKRNIIFAIVIVSAISAVYLYFQVSKSTRRSTNNGSLLTPTRTDLPQVDKIQLDSQLTLPPLPDHLSIYSAEDQPSFAATNADKIAAQFNLQKSSLSVPLWSNPDGTVTVFLSPQDHTLTYKAEFPSSNNVTQLNVDVALQTAQNFLVTIGANQDLSAQKNDIKYYKSGGAEYHPTSANDYNLVEIPYSQTVENIPLFVQSKYLPNVSILVNSQLKISRAIFSPNFIKVGSQLSTQKPLSLDELKKLITKKGFQIIDAFSNNPVTQIPSNIQSININHVTLQYRFDSNSKQIIPYFLLTDTSSPYNISLVAPAVSLK